MTNMKKRLVIGEKVSLVPIGLAQLDGALDFQADIIDGMDTKEFFTPLTREEFITPILGRDNVYFLRYNDELIGLAVATCDVPEVLREYNIPYEDVMLVDSIMVKKEFRGNGLQRQILELLEKKAKELGLKGMTATIHPENIYSLRNFLGMDYKVLHLAFLHGGERLVVFKEL